MPLRSTSLLDVRLHLPGSVPSAEMEGDGFWIGLYEPEGFIHIAPRGVWTVDQATRYRRILRAATGRMVRAGGYKGALFDASAYPAQDMEVMRQHSLAMRTARWIFQVKTSVYSPHPIAGRQLEAATAAGNQRAFWTSVEAVDWLLT